MAFQRREFLAFLGIGIAATASNSLLKSNYPGEVISNNHPKVGASFSDFQPIKYPIPLEINNLDSSQQKTQFHTYEVKDDLVLPEGFKYDVIASWGDKVGDSRFGYNNDYVAFIETSPDEGFLVVNFEYVSPIPWLQGYQTFIGKSLDERVINTLQQARENQQALNIFALPDNDASKIAFQGLFAELLIDQGIGIISVKRNHGKWERTYSKFDRRITGLSGWQDNRYLKVTGPSKIIFQKTQGLGYVDGLGDRIIGTLANCAGGTSPWGTVFSAEENFQNQVVESVMADGTSFSPENMPIEGFNAQGNPFGLQGNKYGWMVEVDPSNPDDYGTKHTWLGRFRHEAVAIRAETGQPLVIYSGCDRTGGHLYKFVSKGKVNNPQDKANSKLLEEGMLYVAKMREDGGGEWIPLKADTPINPTELTHLAGKMLPMPNPDREKAGIVNIDNQETLDKFRQQYARLGDLYQGNSEEEIQGIILIDAHFAGNAIGATCTARPEDLELSPIDQSLVIAFTAGSQGRDGSPDQRIFSNSKGEIYEYGCLMRLRENDNQPSAMTFTWEILGFGGKPSQGGMGFTNPDNLEFDKDGNLWVVTDISSRALNQPQRLPQNPHITGAFGNNSIWYIPLSGENAGKAYPFGIVPIETETCGLCFNQAEDTLFLAIQHPGEVEGTRQNMKENIVEFTLFTTDGEEFKQIRTIPQGSNWPSLKANQPPNPSLVAVYRG